MTEAAIMQEIYEELKLLKEEVSFIKKHMFDPDTIMTTEESRRFEQSMNELKEGKTTPLSEFKKEFYLRLTLFIVDAMVAIIVAFITKSAESFLGACWLHRLFGIDNKNQ